MKKRLLAMLMVLSMALSILPMSAMAAPGDGGGDQEAANQIAKQGEEKTTKDKKVKHSKRIEQTDENTFDITLTVQTKETIEEQVVSEDAAVVLVLDVSNSMDKKDIQSVKEAARNFVEKLTDDASENAQRKVAIVEFGSNAKTVVGWTEANSSQGKNKIENGITAVENGFSYWGKWEKDSGGTNIEGGLRLADNLLSNDQVTNIKNKYVVLMTDGVPTYHVEEDEETDSIDIMYGKRGGGNWATDNDYCDIYDPYQPEKGDTVPKSIKKKAKLYTVFYKNNWGTVGSMDIGSWLSAFSTQLIKAGDDIFEGLENIAEIIVNQAQAWILTDPMGEYIDFGDNTEIPRVTEKGEEGDYTVAFNTSTNTLVWNLRNDTSRTGPVDGWYTYKLTYSVTLDTLKSGFSKENQYATNGNTVLTYILTEDGELQPQLYKTELLVPMVKGFAGDLIFTKKGSDGKILEGAQFTLTCQDNGNWKREATSDKSGKISFTDIPSGHVYTLAETKVPGGYVAVKPIDVTVSYGEVTAKEITDGTLIDPVATGSLAISKTVTAESGLEADSDQEFTFTVDFNGKDVLKGEFPYTVSGSETGNGNVTDGATITLKAGETATITGLPVGTTYTVTETEIPTGFEAEQESINGTISGEGNNAEFTNKYSVGPLILPGETYLTVKKEIQAEGETYTWGEDDSFTFSISADTGVPMPDEEIITISNSTEGHTASFGNIIYKQPGTYQYSIREGHSDIPGMSSDTKVYIVNVQVTVQNGTLVPEVTYQVQQGDKSSDYTEYNINKLLFTNQYDTSKQTVRISGSKELKGEILEAKDFQFQLTGVKKDNGEVIQDQNDVGDIPLPGDLEIGGTVTNLSLIHI